MKYAYVSLVLRRAAAPDPAAIQRLDSLLSQVARDHEIVIATPYPAFRSDGEPVVEPCSGPLTVVYTHARASRDSAAIAGLARSVGDFVVEWSGPLNSLRESLLRAILELTDQGNELVEIVGSDTGGFSRWFYRCANALRPASAPIRKTVGRVFSRHALAQLLVATSFEPHINVLVAELPVKRTEVAVPVAAEEKAGTRQRLNDGMSVLARGTRFGSAIPLGLSAVSAAIAVSAAVYALLVLLVRGRTPEGWTTLMVLTGFGQAAVLAMLGMIWGRLDSLTRGLSRRGDATVSVEVTAPKVNGSVND